MNKKELNTILKLHKQWLESGYKKGSRAVLTHTVLTDADLTGAVLTGADLTGAVLTRANLSGAKGLLSSSKWLKDKFETNKKGMIVYKGVGNTYYSSPDYWKIKANSFLEEVCNPNRTDDCGCGVNFGTKEWVMNEFDEKKVDIWECLILWEDLPGIVVPYNTTGKARCERMKLIKKVNP